MAVVSAVAAASLLLLSSLLLRFQGSKRPSCCGVPAVVGVPDVVGFCYVVFLLRLAYLLLIKFLLLRVILLLLSPCSCCILRNSNHLYYRITTIGPVDFSAIQLSVIELLPQ
jgi:hypothetical protein